uniref:hypothetical protein n=1 Tax=Amycolatopsis sp. CA-096443 TaxID=3239919 RepID=UPI003F4973B2
MHVHDDVLSKRQHELLASADRFAAAGGISERAAGFDPDDYGGRDAVEGLFATAVDLYRAYGDPERVFAIEQVELIVRAAADLFDLQPGEVRQA